MKKKLLTVLMVCTLMFCLTGCDLPLLKKKSDNETKVNESTKKKDSSDKDVINTKDLINDNDSYFVKIKGTKFLSSFVILLFIKSNFFLSDSYI